MANRTEEIQEEAIHKEHQSKTPTPIEAGHEVAQAEDELENSLKNMVNELPGEPFHERLVTIFRLPRVIHENSKELCEPQMLSIGPYHHGKESLRTMEEHKQYTLGNFLAHNENVGLEVYLKAMRSIEIQARQCYTETVNMASDDFVMMLLLDGCFLLEFFILGTSGDAICDVGWISPSLLVDVCLLENQLPFFVIHNLFELLSRPKVLGCSESDHCPLLQNLFAFVKDHKILGPFKPSKISCSDFHHWLHLYYICTTPNPKPETNPVSNSSQPCEFTPIGTNQLIIPCVSELHDAGIKFKIKKRPCHMLDISFNNGIIEMPFVAIDPNIARVTWNLVAFEQSQLPHDLPQTLSSYLALMDALVNTEKDVSILERSGIVNHFFEDDDQVAVFFNQFSKYFHLNYSEHYFYNLFKDVKEYRALTWHRYRARLVQDYFSNPWSIISLVAAGILLVLTVLQTYFSAPS